MSDETNTAETGGENTSKPFTIDDVTKKIFTASDTDNAVAYVGKVQSVVDENAIVWNFDPNGEEGLPEGYGIGVFPVSERNAETKKNVLSQVIIAGVPDFSTVMEDEAGRDFVINALNNAISTKLANAVRNADGPVKLPLSVRDFVTRKTRGDDLKSFNELSQGLIKLLKDMGFKNMNKPTLRGCLNNADMAESQYPKVPQEQWEKLLDVCILMAGKKGLDDSIFVHWKATRDDATFEDDAEIDMSKLDEMLA